MEVYFAIWQKDEEIFKFPLEDVYDAKNTNIEDAAIEYAVDALLGNTSEFRDSVRAEITKGDFINESFSITEGLGYESLPLEINVRNCTAEVNGKHIDLRRKVQIKREWQELEKRLKAGPHIGYLD